MHPILFRIGDFPVGTYALAVLIALAAGCAVFSWLASREGQDRVTFLEMGLWAFILALGASKIFGVLVAFDRDDPWSSVNRALRFSGHFYIGFIAGVAFLVIALRRRGVPLARGLDWLAPALALAHGIGRLGCFLAGCCWGRACELPWAVTFTSADAHRLTGVPLGVALHPTQLYEAVAELIIAAILIWQFLKHRGKPGTTFLTYVLLYGIVRFLLEFVRADPRGEFVGMPTSQPIALVTAIAAGLALLVMSRRTAGGARDR